MIWALIETPEGVANFGEIAAVPGLGAAMLGPFDLAHAIGRPGEVRHPEVAALYDGVMAIARENGLEVVASLFSAEPAAMTAEKAELIASKTPEQPEPPRVPRLRDLKRKAPD